MTEPQDESNAVPLPSIAQQIRDAAADDTFRSGARIPNEPDPSSALVNERLVRLQEAIDRAHRKAFVPAIKPLRRLLRNQGAVNDSVIEALCHLAAEIRELKEEQSKLRTMLNMLEAQLPEAARDRQDRR